MYHVFQPLQSFPTCLDVWIELASRTVESQYGTHETAALRDVHKMALMWVRLQRMEVCHSLRVLRVSSNAYQSSHNPSWTKYYSVGMGRVWCPWMRMVRTVVTNGIATP